jgi:hypothetical protein
MAKKSNPNAISFGWTRTPTLPSGALVLVVATHPERRDSLLADALIEGNRRPTLAVCATETPQSFLARLKATYADAVRSKCEDEAERDVPRIQNEEKNPGLISWEEDDEVFKRKRAAYQSQEPLRRARTASVKTLAAEYNRKMTDAWMREAKKWLSVVKAPENGLLGLPTRIGEAVVLVLDDASALSLDGKKLPSSKHVADVARGLKRLALDRELVVVAGVPAPLRMVKDRTSAHPKEAATDLADLAAYGNPQEAADVVLCAGIHTYTLFSRYARTGDS